jgi:predicted dehydrogenase
VEDNAMILMEHMSGTLSHVQSGFNYFDPYGHEGTGQTKPTISMWGTKGNMHLIGYDWAPFGVDMATHDSEKTTRYATDTQGYVWQEGATVVAGSLVTGADTLVAAEHSLHVLEIIGAARESQSTGRRVALESKFKWPVVS